MKLTKKKIEVEFYNLVKNSKELQETYNLTAEKCTEKINNILNPVKKTKFNFLTAINTIREKKASLPILEKIKVESGILTATNLECFLSMPTNLDDGIYSISKKTFIPYKTEENIFPVLDLKRNEFKQIFTNSIDIENIKKGFNFVSDNELKPALKGVYLQLRQDHYKITSTDIHKFFNIKKNWNVNLGENLDLIIPTSAVKCLTKAPENEVKIFVYKKQSCYCVQFNTENFQLITKCINETYPGYENILPNRTDKIIEVNKLDFLQALKELEPYVNKKRDLIAIEYIKDNLVLYAEDLDRDIKYSTMIKSEFVSSGNDFSIGDPFYICMPVRIDNDDEYFENIVNDPDRLIKGFNLTNLKTITKSMDNDKIQISRPVNDNFRLGIELFGSYLNK